MWKPAPIFVENYKAMKVKKERKTPRFIQFRPDPDGAILAALNAAREHLAVEKWTNLDEVEQQRHRYNQTLPGVTNTEAFKFICSFMHTGFDISNYLLTRESVYPAEVGKK